MPKFKSLDKFIPLQGNNNTAPSIHETCFVEKSKNGSRWVLKDLAKNYSEATEETVAQEFFRLICPFYPKTRWAAEKGHYYVLSKEIPEFNPLFFLEPKNYYLIENESIKGLASAQILALLLGEVDFKAGNVGVDSNGNIIKIDGGLCFPKQKKGYWSLLVGKNLAFTQEDIEALPAVINYQPFNWLDLFQWDAKSQQSLKNPNSILLNLPKKYLTYFEIERNKTILLICLLPDELIYYFTQNYIPTSKKADELAEIIIESKKRLEKISNKIPSFIKYRKSAQARNDIIEYVDYLKTFKTMGKNVLLDEVKKHRNIDIKTHIFKETILEYILIENFFVSLNIHYILLTAEQYNQFSYVSKSSQAINGIIRNLTSIMEEYFNIPSFTNYIVLRKSLQTAKELLPDIDFPTKDSLMLPIDNIINQLDKLQKEIPIPAPRKINNKRSFTESHTLFSNKKQNFVTMREAGFSSGFSDLTAIGRQNSFGA
ncbi:MAG: hypothetical protein V4471_07605 [Pseudomonadota bacterium]